MNGMDGPAYSPVSVPASMTIDFVSALNARHYRLLVSLPMVPPPAAGFPVLYVLDGQAYHGLVTDASRNRSSIGREIAPAIVVGIGYAEDDPLAWTTLRALDFTPSKPRVAPPGVNLPLEKCGGADTFLDVIDQEIMPRIAAAHRVDQRNSVVFGHSLGGLLALYALLRRPEMFGTYLAVSPSIWWDGAILLAHLPSFSERIRSGIRMPKVFVAVGGLEESTPNMIPDDAGLTREQYQAILDDARTIGNARDLASRLREIAYGEPDHVQFVSIPGETHVTVPYAALRQALDLALPPPQTFA